MKSFGSTNHSAVKAFDKLFLKPKEVFSYKTLNRKKPFLYNVGEREMGLEPYIWDIKVVITTGTRLSLKP